MHSDTFESRVVHKGPVLAAAVTCLPTGLPRLAIAVRMGLARVVHLVAHEILPAGGKVAGWRQLWEVSIPPAQAVSSLGWCGNAIICGTGELYLLAWQRRQDSSSKGGTTGAWRELLASSPGSVSAVVSLPKRPLAVVIAGGVGVVVNAAGEPVGNPISLEALPPVRAFAAASEHIVAVCESGMYAFHLMSGSLVQRLDFGAGMSPAPGQPLLAAGGGDAACPAVLVAGCHKVWMLAPIPPSRQALDLLERREYDAALALASEAERQGQAWAAEAYAQAALLYLHGAFSPGS